MAIYHLQAKMITRNTGRSVVAASAYASCSTICNEYDGITHDYSRKRGLIYSEVLLPSNAPNGWIERDKLWNAVEEIEKAKDSRLARELVVALPVEITSQDWIILLKNFIQKECVDKGMCADFSIHDTDGHNPHAHILLTVRPLDEKGKWQAKTQKEYLCSNGIEEKGFTAEEFKLAKSQGFEKQYMYKNGKKKTYLTPSNAEKIPNCTRVSKSPKSTRYGRQNPICEKWNSEEQILHWRKSWEIHLNQALDICGWSDRVDSRSNAERGITEQATIHEGVHARNLEKVGIVSDKCELNRQIKADNLFLKELKNKVKKLTKAIKESVPLIAENLENIRNSLILTQYQFLGSKQRTSELTRSLDYLVPPLEEYKQAQKFIKDKSTQKKKLVAERKTTSILKPIKHIQINREIATLTEEIEELKNRMTQILNELECSTEAEFKSLNSDVKIAKSDLEKLKIQQEKLSINKEKDIEKFQEIKSNITPENETEVLTERSKIRAEKEKSLINKLQQILTKQFDYTNFKHAKDNIDDKLNEDIKPIIPLKESLSKPKNKVKSKKKSYER
ncbi:MAG: MobQ family relaxase [Clostridia bacterium]